MENNWSVYKHTFPDDSVYYGITSMKPEERWGNGLHYESQRRIFTKIVKYGWDNIKHEIIASGLGEETARKIESELIYATPYEKCNNTVCNINPNPQKKKSPEWYDEEVNDGKCLWSFLVELGDDEYDEWRQKYVLKNGIPPHSGTITRGRIELFYCYSDEEKVYFYEYGLDIPSELRTYLDYWNYLQEPRTMTLVKSSEIGRAEFTAKYCDKAV